MKSRLLLIVIFPAAMIVLLAGCQVFPGIFPSSAAGGSSQPTPAPLTGGQASTAGASALLQVQKPGNNGSLLEPFSATTGEPVDAAAPIDFGQDAQYAFSPDRRLLAFATSSTKDCLDKCLHLLDMKTWKETIAPVVLSSDGSLWAMLAFNQAGTQVAVVLNNTINLGASLLLVDLSQDKVIRQAQLASYILQIGFTSDNSLAVYGNRQPQPGKADIMYVALYDSSSLQLKWQQDVDLVTFSNEADMNLADPSQGRYLYPAAAFSSNGNYLYVVAADVPRLVTVDFSRRSVSSADIHPPQSLLERLLASTASVVYAKTLNGTTKTGVLSLDGRYMFVVGQTSTAVKDNNGDWTAKLTPLGLQVIDLSDGVEVAHVATPAEDVSVSLDGKILLLRGYGQSTSGTSQPWTDLLDAATYKVVDHYVSLLIPSRLLNGDLVWLSTIWSDSGNNQLAIYDTATRLLRVQREGSLNEDASWISIP